MKVRVLKEMPFAKVGEIHQIDIKKMCCFNFNWYTVEDLIKDGWLEEVKEESLANKMKEYDLNGEGRDYYKDLAEIAKKYFKEHPEELGLKKGSYCKECDYYKLMNGFVSIDEVLECFDKLNIPNLIRVYSCWDISETDCTRIYEVINKSFKEAIEGLRK